MNKNDFNQMPDDIFKCIFVEAGTSLSWNRRMCLDSYFT